ncbi:MAG: FAD-binding oxidoreductase [Pseudomonadota bacterium]
MTAIAQSATPALVEALAAALGSESVSTDPARLDFLAHDVYGEGAPLAAAVRPTNVDALCEAVRVCSEHSAVMIPRGGGLSYTNAYLAPEAGAVLFDLGALDRIVEVNETDRYVTVEAGVTWDALYRELEPRGLRTPYWGPLSGLYSTIGGAASQGSIFLGSSRYGTAGDAIQNLEVVVADGSLIRTGSSAHANSSPFMRYYGPDLTGLFCNDAGALGIKARITLRLIPAHAHRDAVSTVFDRWEDLLDAMARVGASGIASEAFAFDPELQAQRMKRASVAEDVKTLANVVGKSGGLLKGMKEGAKIVAAGRNFLGEKTYSFHVCVEADSKEELKANMKRARALIGDAGREVENSIPTVLRAQPFTPPTVILGPEGERWVPVHGIVPHSRGAETFAALEALYASHRSATERLDIDVGYLMTTIAGGALLIEPVFYWPDARTVYHDEVLEDAVLSRLKRFEENPEAAALVAELRKATVEVFRSHGGTHFQIGRTYPYGRDLEPATLALLRGIKAQLDPQGLMNPGALSIDA